MLLCFPPRRDKEGWICFFLTSYPTGGNQKNPGEICIVSRVIYCQTYTIEMNKVYEQEIRKKKSGGERIKMQTHGVA